MQVKITSNKDKEGYFTVVPYGSIDSDTHEIFKEKVMPVLDKPVKMLLVDLSNVDYISSAGLGVLFTIKKALIANKGELLFCNLKPQIAKLFEVVKALPKESVFRTVEEADRYFYSIMNEEIKRQEKNKQI